MEMDSCRIKLFVGSVAVGHYTLHLLSDGCSVLEYQSVDCASTPLPTLWTASSIMDFCTQIGNIISTLYPPGLNRIK